MSLLDGIIARMKVVRSGMEYTKHERAIGKKDRQLEQRYNVMPYICLIYLTYSPAPIRASK